MCWIDERYLNTARMEAPGSDMYLLNVKQKF
jgi:hypothetical protein